MACFTDIEHRPRKPQTSCYPIHPINKDSNFSSRHPPRTLLILHLILLCTPTVPCPIPFSALVPPSTPVHTAPPPYGSFPFKYAPYAPPYMPYLPFGSPYPPNPHAPAMAGPSMSPARPNLQESSSDSSNPEGLNPYPEMTVFMETLATLYPKRKAQYEHMHAHCG